MNDDFLKRLRAEPPPEFARQLKARLDAQNPRRFWLRARYWRGLGIALLLGGAAYAVGTGSLRLFRHAADEPQAATLTPASEPARAVAAPPLPSSAPSSSLTADGEAAAASETTVGAPSRSASQRDAGAPATAASAAPESEAAGTKLGGGRRDPLTVVGTPGTEPHTAQALELLDRYRVLPPHAEVVPADDAAARACDVARGTLDVLVTFNRMRESDWQSCLAVSPAFARLPEPVAELLIGYEAAVVARSVLYGPVDLSARSLFLALARDVPSPGDPSETVANPYRAWHEIDPKLTDYIAVVGPPVDSPAARAFAELVMQRGCAALPRLAGVERGDTVCRSIREDGVYVEHTRADAAVRQLETEPALFAVLSGGDFVLQQAKLAGAALDGVAPTFETIANGTYPASRPLYVYTARGVGSGKPGRVELVESYLRLPETQRVLIVPDNATRMEMSSRVRLIVRTAITGDLR